MNATPQPLTRGRPVRAAWALTLALILSFPLPPVQAAAPAGVAPRPGVASALLAEGWLSDLSRDFHSLLATRRGMTIVASVFMFIALWVIWYRRN